MTDTDSHRHAAERSRLRAYLAGGGATTALIGSALVGFLAIVALVAFNGLPFTDAGDGGAVAIAEPAAGAPEAAALALGDAAPDAVASSPAAPTALAGPPGGSSPAGGPSSPPLAQVPGDSSQPPGAPLPPAPPGGGGSDTVGDAVAGIEGTTNDLGLGLPLSELTGPVTRPLDRTLNQTLNGLGLGGPGGGGSGSVNRLLP